MGRRKLSRLTKEQHKRYGLFLKLFEDGFLHLNGILHRTYPQNHRLVKACDKILLGLDSLVSELDHQVCEQYPYWEDNIECYYGERPWKGREEALIEAVASLELPSRRPNDLEQILDMGSHLTDLQCLEVYEIKTRLDCLMQRVNLDETSLYWRVQNILDGQRRRFSKITESPQKPLEQPQFNPNPEEKPARGSKRQEPNIINRPQLSDLDEEDMPF
jgi:hypothetical protein